jgi:hypothetical protein
MTGNATYHVRERIYSHYSNMSDNKLAYSNAIVVWESIAKKKMAKRSDLLQNRLWKQGGEQQGRSDCVQTIVYQEQLGNSLKDLPKGVR